MTEAWERWTTYHVEIRELLYSIDAISGEEEDLAALIRAAMEYTNSVLQALIDEGQHRND